MLAPTKRRSGLTPRHPVAANVTAVNAIWRSECANSSKSSARMDEGGCAIETYSIFIHIFDFNYNWINELSNTTTWRLDVCCLLHRYQLHVSALMAIFRLID